MLTSAHRVGPFSVVVAALTDRGVSRAENQDAVCATVTRQQDLLLAVADGVGGRNAGAWASTRTLELLPVAVSGSSPQQLQSAVEQTNQQVFQEARADAAKAGAASTLVAALVTSAGLWWANVGDSRVYLIRSGGLRQLSTDHSYVEGEIAAGRLSRAEAEVSPMRNIITRSIGAQPTVTADGDGPLALQDGDRLLLCSDGLHAVIPAHEIAGTVTEMDPQSAVRQLIQQANRRGGPDNISVVVAAISIEAPRKSWLTRLLRR